MCIIQDDPADKLRELPRMSFIYQGAEIVFAVHGPGLGWDKMPLTPIQDPRHLEDSPVYCREKISHEVFFKQPQDGLSWAGRAWCMQERIFAQRILHFGGRGEELFFECNTLTACECDGMMREMGGRARTLKQRIRMALARVEDEADGSVAPDALWRIYIAACEDYTPRGLSFTTDKLPAVSSLMHTFLPHLGKYCAGIWEHNFIINLQWEVSDTNRCRRHETYVSPSFSWASISGGVIWYTDTDKPATEATHDFATIVDVSCTPATNDPCGPASEGYITLRSRVVDMKMEETKRQWMPDGRIEMTKDGSKSAWVTLDSRDDYNAVEPGMTVTCLDIMRDKGGLHGRFVSGLVLLPPDLGGGRSGYRRIGFSTMLDEHFKDSTLETITIF